jgi:DNA-binding NarL/FixJ family response regulator
MTNEGAIDGVDARLRIFVVDDHPLFRQGLGALLETTPGMTIVGEAGCIEDVRAAVTRLEFDVAIIDVWLLSVGGVTITSELRRLRPNCRVLGLSVVEEPAIIAEMLRAGATGFALKTDPPDEIVRAIRETAAGTRYISHRLPREQIEMQEGVGASAIDNDANLTKREREILELVIRGFSNQEIASRLFIARRTVETHRYRIARKLDAHSVYEMQRAAARRT